jgi:hypothetical protein
MIKSLMLYLIIFKEKQPNIYTHKIITPLSLHLHKYLLHQSQLSWLRSNFKRLALSFKGWKRMFTDCNIANAITDAAKVKAASTS